MHHKGTKSIFNTEDYIKTLSESGILFWSTCVCIVRSVMVCTVQSIWVSENSEKIKRSSAAFQFIYLLFKSQPAKSRPPLCVYCVFLSCSFRASKLFWGRWKSGTCGSQHSQGEVGWWKGERWNAVQLPSHLQNQPGNCNTSGHFYNFLHCLLS